MSARNGQQRAGMWLAALVTGVALLGGCASPASREGMTVPQVMVAKHHPYSVSVGVQGGVETGALDSSNIANADFKAALERSITESRLFSTVVEGKDGDYALTVVISRVDKPLFGTSFTVELEAGWSLLRLSDRSVAMRKVIKSAHTATMSDALAGVTRLRLALEGAARNNIEQGLRAIAELNL